MRNEDLVQWVSLAALQKNAKADSPEFTAGDVVEFNAPMGGQYAGILQAIDAEGAWFDFNHPLAGKTITFEVKIISIL
jgi:FKBP-type peptidyl-prolyl cis-trans isomerase SlpA